MADIFISYSSEDKTRVKTIAEALEHKGWTVWWDRRIPVGQRFDTVIEQELNKARCVIVIWTQRSVNSEWVKNEANEAAQRNILAPVLLEDVKIPLAFRRIEAAQLSSWKGETDHPELEILFSAVTAIINGNEIAGPAMTGDTQSTLIAKRIEKRKKAYIFLTAAGCLLSGFSLYYYFTFLHENSGPKTGSTLFYFFVILFGISISAMLSGAINSWLIVKGKKGNAGLQLSGPALGAILMLLGAFYLPRQPGIPVVRITGQVKTAAEIPVKGVEVNADGTRFFATTITNGTYNLTLENYTVGDEVTLTTSNKDFEDKTIAVKISDREMKVDFVLNPVTR